MRSEPTLDFISVYLPLNYLLQLVVVGCISVNIWLGWAMKKLPPNFLGRLCECCVCLDFSGDMSMLPEILAPFGHDLTTSKS